MTQKIKYMFVFVLLLSTSIAITAQANFQAHLFSTDTVLKYRAEIDLSEAQVSAVKKIHSDHITEFNSLKWDLDAAQVALVKRLAVTSVDEEASLADMEKIMGLENGIKKNRLGMLIKVKNILSQEQQDTLKTLRTKEDLNGLSFVTSIAKDPRISIKGNVGSGGKEPLFVIFNKKGERQPNGTASVKNLDPNVIQSVTVLKGKAAEDKYGKEGKNGVVVIYLKNN